MTMINAEKHENLNTLYATDCRSPHCESCSRHVTSYKRLLVDQKVIVSDIVLQAKEDCWLSKRRRRDQAADVHPLHWIVATGNVSHNYWQVCITKVCVSVCRQWAFCSSLITSPTAWSTSPTWWMIFGIMPETGPQTWVDPIILNPRVLPILPSFPLFIITHAISGPLFLFRN